MFTSRRLTKSKWECIHFATNEEVANVQQELAGKSLTFYESDVSHVVTDQELFNILSKTLRFPDYFGNNWDAFDECIRDLEWLPSDGYVLIIAGGSHIWRQAPSTAGKLIESWLFAAEDWSGQDVSFHLVFVL